MPLQPEPHPFATAMTEFLLESGMRARRPGLMQAMMSGTNAKYEADIKTMSELVHESENSVSSRFSVLT